MKKSLDDIHKSILKEVSAKNEVRVILDRETIEIDKKRIEVNRRLSNIGGAFIKEIPLDFFISGSALGSQLTYLSGNYKVLDLQSYTTTRIYNINEVIRNGNDLYLTINFSDDPAIFNSIIKLGGCFLVNGFLSFKSFNIQILPISRIHGSIFYRGWIYVNNRPLTDSEYHTTIRINKDDLSDIISLQVPNSITWQGQPTDIIGYKGNIYTILGKASNTVSYFIKLDLDLISYSLVFLCGNVSSTKRVRLQSPFIIYQDEVYIPTYNNASQPLAGNSIGISVYSLTGTILREIAGITVTTGNTNRPFPHWFQIFNDKLIMTNSGSTHKWMARFDKTTLIMEEIYNTGLFITDDNSIMTNGYIYLNAETVGGIINSQLIKIKYDNFLDIGVEIPIYNGGYGSYGSINYNHYLDL